MQLNILTKINEQAALQKKNNRKRKKSEPVGFVVVIKSELPNDE